jgi:hypothetical protein
MVMAVAMPVDGLNRFTRLLRPVLIIVLAAPAAWMLLQVIPVPRALANPIWASAAAALSKPIPGVVTIDVGASLLALARYSTVVAAVIITTALALDRQRAAHILYILVVIATLITARQIALEVTFFDLLSVDGEDRAQASVATVIGILLSCAVAIQAGEKLQRSGRPQRSRTTALIPFSVALLSLFVCAAAVLIPANPVVVIAAVLGVTVLLAVFAIRRWGLGRWGAAGLAAAAAIALLGALGAVPVKKNAELVTALSMQNQAVTERMLPDVPPAGSGAGTFEALFPIYRDIGTAAMKEYPTAAALIMIEMGPIFLAGLVIATLIAAWMLFRRSLSRGQDYIYAAAGASALVSLTILAFVNGGILHFGASVMIGALCGLALAQSLSGATRNHMALNSNNSSDEMDKQGRNTASKRTTFDKTWPRVTLAIFGLLLTEQAGWILFPNSYFPDQIWPSMGQNAVASGGSGEEIWKAASLARVRGDLWAKAGFALVARPGSDPAAGLFSDNSPEQALDPFTRALRFSPHRGDVWLMFAALANHYKLAGYDTAALLKMSYYTAPNEFSLLPMRLRVALASDVREAELRNMIKRDIRLVLSRLSTLEPALVIAYRSAPADRKVFAENLIAEVDPLYLKTIRTPRP